MDEMVLNVQKWLNATYEDIDIAEDGYTGQGTVTALIKALQHELNSLNAGISVDGDFGTGSFRAFQEKVGSIGPGSANVNLNYIVQGGCWCKGYNPKYFDGDFGAATAQAISDFQEDAGVTATGSVTAVVMKALLNTDGFKWSISGNSDVRRVQQFLNGHYNGTYGSDIGLIPTNGIYERKTSKAMLYAVQVEGNVGTDGVWGDGTKGCLPTLSEGSTNTSFVRLLQCALALNRFYSGAIDGKYDESVTDAVRDFQSRMALDADGITGVSTWCALLVSCGDKQRPARACDCATKLTPSKAQTLVDNGYEMVGRYLTGKMAGGASKALDRDELRTIQNAGLRLFAIFETGGDSIHYFSYAQGRTDAAEAIEAASALGINRDAILYYAVDVDAVQDQIEDAIIPYFKGIHDYTVQAEKSYPIGAYGTRNVCENLNQNDLIVSAFIADMSYGWSGNMGYNIPAIWAFDQFATVGIGSGDGYIEIDKDSASGSYQGESRFNIASTKEQEAQNGFIQRVFQDMPFAEGIPAVLEIGETYTLFNLGCLKAELSYNTAMGTEQPNSITIRNGELDSAKLKVLEDFDLSMDLKQQYLDPLKSLGLSVSNGMISVDLEGLTLGRVAISITVSSDDIDVGDGTKTTVSVTLKYTILPTEEIKEKLKQAIEESAQAAKESFLLLVGAFASAFEKYRDVILTTEIIISFVLIFLGGAIVIFA